MLYSYSLNCSIFFHQLCFLIFLLSDPFLVFDLKLKFSALNGIYSLWCNLLRRSLFILLNVLFPGLLHARLQPQQSRDRVGSLNRSPALSRGAPHSGSNHISCLSYSKTGSWVLSPLWVQKLRLASEDIPQFIESESNLNYLSLGVSSF